MHYFQMGNPTKNTENKDLELTPPTVVRKSEGTSQSPSSQQ